MKSFSSYRRGRRTVRARGPADVTPAATPEKAPENASGTHNPRHHANRARSRSRMISSQGPHAKVG
ncbi:hypothetical protein GTY68_09570 [Streptomyces sp. SID4926]|nr:hypothetical protein [Streptomyces sp. SID4926]